MSESRKVVSGHLLLEDINEALTMVVEPVASTLGPGGKIVLIERRGLDASNNLLKPVVTKDGVSVARNIRHVYPKVDTIIRTILQVAEKTVVEAGDGTTTALVLANAIYREGIKLAGLGHRIEKVISQMEGGLQTIYKELEGLSIPIRGKDNIQAIATISLNNDEKIGELIADAFEEVGDEGTITLSEGYSQETTLNIQRGFTIDRGLFRPDIFDTSPGECILHDCSILIYDGEVDDSNDIMPFINHVTKGGAVKKDFLIIARDFKGQGANFILVNCIEKTLGNFAVIKGPHVGHVRTAMLHDIAITTGAKVLTRKEQLALKVDFTKHNEDPIGFASKVHITKDKTIIYNRDRNEEDVLVRIEELKKLKETHTSPYDRSIVEGRIATLSGSVAVIQVGARTELEMKEKKDRIEDALNATYCSIKEGIIPGGGASLLHISQNMDPQNVGEKILQEALKAPFYTIVNNIGKNGDALYGEILSKASKNANAGILGYDAVNEKIVGMVESAIIDPLKVTKTALKNAVSIATLLLSCSTCISYNDKTPTSTQETP